MKDLLGDSLKSLEAANEPAAMTATLPIYARLDGRGFSKFTKSMTRPFDEMMTGAMQDVARGLMEASQARAAYTQSDEISLVWLSENEASEGFFAGKVSKTISVLASLAAALFAEALIRRGMPFADWAARLPHFDARVCQMPDQETAARMVAWRGEDAARNAINQIARTEFSHKSLQGVSLRDTYARLEAKGLDPKSFPQANLNGTLIRNLKVRRPLSRKERMAIPKWYRPQPDQEVSRREISVYSDAPPHRIDNLAAVLFDGAKIAVRQKRQEDTPGN